MSTNIAHVIEQISAAGYSVHHDANFGALVDSIIGKDFNLYSKEGFNLLRAVLRNDLVPNVIKELLPEPVLIFYRVFGRTRYIHSIMNRKHEKSMQMLVVWCWSNQTEAAFYSGSHLHHLNAVHSHNGLLQVSNDALQHDDIQQNLCHMESGGFAIVDARCAWQMTDGLGILFGFAVPDEAKWWVPMPYPPELQNIVTNMMDGTGITFKAKYDDA